jgi:hypothetical protein
VRIEVGRVFDRCRLGEFGGTADQAETAGGVSGVRVLALDAGRDRFARLKEVAEEVRGR